MQRKLTSSSSPQKFKLAGKIMCTIFWDAEGVLPVDFMPHKVTVTGLYYADLLHKLLVTITEKKKQGKLTQVPLLLHNNA